MQGQTGELSRALCLMQIRGESLLVTWYLLSLKMLWSLVTFCYDLLVPGEG